jgi:hypothetical protein
VPDASSAGCALMLRTPLGPSSSAPPQPTSKHPEGEQEDEQNPKHAERHVPCLYPMVRSAPFQA